MLTPKTGHGAAVLHRNSVALAEQGPWNFASVTWGDAVEGPADGEASSAAHKVRSGTCDVCGAAIINIVELRSATGGRATVGVDCADTLMTNQAKLRLKAAIAPYEKAKREAAKVRKVARTVAKYAAELVTLEALAALPDTYRNNFARSFAGSVRLALRGGKALSEKQAAMITKLAGELL